MAVNYRTAYLEAYKEEKTFIPFLSSFFRTRPSDIRDAESVKIDVQRGTRYIAPVISNFVQHGSKIKRSQYTSKEYTPPVVALQSDFAAGDLISKAFGKSEYETEQMGYMQQLQNNIMDVMVEIENEINRHIEYQAAQVLQTASGITLYDENCVAAYTIDFLTKASHFPLVSIDWEDEDSDPDSDIYSLYRVIKQDSGADARNVIFGKDALRNYLRNAKIQDKFDIRNYAPGTVNPQDQSPDAVFLGEILIENKRFRCWSYEGEYVDPSDSSSPATLPFVGDDKVILIPDAGSMNMDLRRVYCNAPSIGKLLGQDLGLLPATINLDNRAYTGRSWYDDDGDQAIIEIKTRPLLIPVAIDCFGCIDTEA